MAGTTMEMVLRVSRQIYHYFADKETLVRAVIEYQNETIVGGQEPMLAKLDSLAGLRAWRDFLVEHQRQLGCRGGCPIGALGSELAEIDPQARVAVAAGSAGGRRASGAASRPCATAASLARMPARTGSRRRCWPRSRAGLLLSQVQRSTVPLEVALDTVIDHIGAQMVPAAS